MNITDPVWRNCHVWPERDAVILDGQLLTYRALRQSAERAMARLHAAGVAPRDVLALGLVNPLTYLILALASARLGATVMPFKSHWAAITRRDLLRRNRVRWLLSHDAGGDAEAVAVGIHCLSARDLLVTDDVFEPPLPSSASVCAGDDVWLIALSSGTTGVFKSIPQTHARSGLAWTLVSDGAEGEAEADRVFVYVDLATSVGFGVVMRQLYVGGTSVLTRNFSPESVLAAIERDRPTRLVTSTGNITDLTRHAAQAVPNARLRCASLKSLSVTGSTVPLSLRKAITTHICTNLRIPYGATETGRLATATKESLSLQPESAGRIHSWVQAQAVDERHQPLAPGQHGALRFRTPYMAVGYLDDPQANARTFRDGWCYTGDTGRVDAGGYVTLGGRTNEVLNLGGHKLDPTRIEAVLDAQPGIQESAVVLLEREGEKPVLVAVLVTQGQIDAPAMTRACREQLGAEYCPDAIVTADVLPRNNGGKVMRRELVARLAQQVQGQSGAPQVQTPEPGERGATH